MGGTHWTTTTTDPDTTHNQSLIDFQQDSTTTYNFYEMQRKSYQGSVGGTLLLTTTDCYNGNLSCTPSSAVFSPISQVDTYKTLPGKTGASHVEASYNFYGLVTDRKQYD